MNLNRFNLKKFINKPEKVTILPNGEYDLELKNIFMKKSNKGDNILNLSWVVLGGIYDGESYNSYFNLNNPGSLEVLSIMIMHMGFNIDDVDDTSVLIGSKCHAIIKVVFHDIHGASNIVHRYLPVRGLAAVDFNDIPFDVILGLKT